jgi:hypothetical protein
MVNRASKITLIVVGRSEGRFALEGLLEIGDGLFESSLPQSGCFPNYNLSLGRPVGS